MRRLDDDSLSFHARVPERLQAVTAAECDEQPARPFGILKRISISGSVVYEAVSYEEQNG